ncbi:MAG: HEAT repeat domain-containing protein [Planctomycetaceae bacterium]|nr:HEAT repeat domain-containing protein [Planctomycetaceae bacterium]
MRTGVSVSSEKLVSTAVLELLNNLKLAVAQLRLYPKDSPQVTKVGTSAFQSVAAFLDQNAKLVLAATPNGLLINGQRLGAKDFATVTLESSLISFFLDAGIKSIAFRKGASLDELLTFLDALVRKFWDAKEGKEINRLLQERQVLSIGVDEIEYVAVSEGDLVIKDATRTLEKTGSRVSELMKTLEQIIEASVDPQVGAEGRLEIMRKLIEHDPTLLEKARAEPLPQGRADKVPGLLPLEKGRAAVGELARILSIAPEGLRPGLRKVGNILIDAYRHDVRLMSLMKQFLLSEAEELVPVWMTDEFKEVSQESGPTARARTLLALAADEQAEPLVKEAAVLVRELLAISRGDLAAKILARLTGILMDRTAERRRAAATALLALHNSWDTEPLSAAREGFEGLLRSAFDEEQDADAYGKLAEIATILADGRLRRGEPEMALETLSLLRRHHATKDPALAFRPETAFRAMERVTKSAGFPQILHKLRTGDPVALRVAESLGDAAAAHLVEEMKKIELTTQRMPFADAVARVGPGAAAVLSEELQKVTAPSEALRLLEVLPHAAPETIACVALASTLHHPVSAVRRRSAAILTDRAYARSGDLLLQALKDEKDPTIRATIIEGLGKLKISAAFETLAALADSRSESDEIRAGACMALARLGHGEAVPILAGIASKGSRGLGLLKATSPALRSAAIRALGQFPSNPAAREALKKITEDSDPTLQAAARETLYRPVQKALSTAGREAQQLNAVQEVKATNVKLAGSLQEIPLDQVCQLIGGSEKTGLLMLSLEGRVGRIWFEKGLVAAADFERTRDQEAINGIARHKKGDFIFQPGERPPERRVQIPVHQALLEAFRVADEGQK